MGDDTGFDTASSPTLNLGAGRGPRAGHVRGQQRGRKQADGRGDVGRGIGRVHPEHHCLHPAR